MACLIVPATAALAVSTIKKRVPAHYHIEWLLFMLWGGVIMLVVDHIISGEIIFTPPFLTAGTDKLINEIFWVGVPMTLVILVVWLIVVWGQRVYKYPKARLFLKTSANNK